MIRTEFENKPGTTFDPANKTVLYAEDMNGIMDSLLEIQDINTMKPIFSPQTFDFDTAGPFFLGVVPPGKKFFIIGFVVKVNGTFNSSNAPYMGIQILGGGYLMDVQRYNTTLSDNFSSFIPQNTAGGVVAVAGDSIVVDNNTPGSGGGHVYTISLLGYLLDA